MQFILKTVAKCFIEVIPLDMTHCNGSSVDKLKEKNLNGHASGHASGHTSSNVEDEVNAKYMRCLEEPYKYHTQVPGKAVSLVN